MRSATYDAVLFDLDGVLTPTRRLHTRCWKETFDPSSSTSRTAPAPASPAAGASQDLPCAA